MSSTIALLAVYFAFFGTFARYILIYFQMLQNPDRFTRSIIRIFGTASRSFLAVSDIYPANAAGQTWSRPELQMSFRIFYFTQKSHLAVFVKKRIALCAAANYVTGGHLSLCVYSPGNIRLGKGTAEMAVPRDPSTGQAKTKGAVEMAPWIFPGRIEFRIRQIKFQTTSYQFPSLTSGN